MNPISLLTNSIGDLWYWTYGLVAGWGLTFTVMVVAVLLLIIRQIRLQKQVDQLEHRVIQNEREYNLANKTWPGKTTKN
jgi:hypothetical protein